MTAVWVGLGVGLGFLAVAATAVWLAWRLGDEEQRRVVRRAARLPLRRKLRLALALARDRRVPLPVRAVPPALVLYLAMPLDVIPDFIPVIGYLDDVLLVAAAAGLLLRFTPRGVVEEHVARLEADAQRS